MHKFSKHFSQRMQERGISTEEVLSIINKEVNVVIYPSLQDKEIDLYFGKINHKYLLIVCNKNTKTLITIRRMRKNEKAIFEEVIRNETK